MKRLSYNRKKTFVQSALLFAALLCCMSSCVNALGNKNCSTDMDVFLQASFYSVGLDSKCSVVTGSVQALGNDSVWQGMKECSELSLPLNPNDEKTAYAVSFMLTDSTFVADTLYFSHTNCPYMVSIECGGMVVHDLQSVSCTTHCVDSLTVLAAHVDNVVATHVKIWLP